MNLKQKSFERLDSLTKFVNDHGIKKGDIENIQCCPMHSGMTTVVVWFLFWWE